MADIYIVIAECFKRRWQISICWCDIRGVDICCFVCFTLRVWDIESLHILLHAGLCLFYYCFYFWFDELSRQQYSLEKNSSHFILKHEAVPWWYIIFSLAILMLDISKEVSLYTRVDYCYSDISYFIDTLHFRPIAIFWWLRSRRVISAIVADWYLQQCLPACLLSSQSARTCMPAIHILFRIEGWRLLSFVITFRQLAMLHDWLTPHRRAATRLRQ